MSNERPRPTPTAADAFRAALGARAPEPASEAGRRLAAELAPRLDAALEAARAAWPTIDVPADVFARALAERLDPDEDPLSGLAGVRAGDLWLACACARGDAAAIRLFDERFLSKVPALISRVEGADQLAPEVAQELREKLLVPAGGRTRLEDYSARGDLLGWLRVVALRTALKLRRRKVRDAGESLEAPAGTAADAADGLFAGPDPERDYLRVRYRGEYEQALRDAMAALPAPDKLLLKLHYADALSLERLAAMYRVHRATIARRLAEARRRLLASTKELLAARLRLSESEFESVLALVRSQLAFSVRSALS